MPWNSRPVNFNPETDIPPLDGRVILITGGTHGLGKQSVLEFARHNPREIWLAARNVDRARTVASEITQTVPGATIHILQLDLASFPSVEKAAKTFLSACDRLDILMLNAGIMAVPPGTSNEGYEIQFGTNHMGHALLSKLLLPILDKTANIAPGADVRIVSVSSKGHRYLPRGGFRFDSLTSMGDGLGAYERYYQSKLANVLWVKQMAEMYPQFRAAAVHPGVVQTQLMYGATASPTVVRAFAKVAYRLFKPVEKGVRNQLWASVAQDVHSGEYYEPVGVRGRVSEDGKDRKLAQELWEWTENELNGYLARPVE
ncbi:short-chain dehydrogenase/reductase [Aspergillus floccosus]